jgi:hypothetical protein
MIKVFLRGGLGNQMFQYAAALGVAKKQGNADIILDTTFLNDRFPRRQFTYRTYDLDIFNINPKFSLLSEVSAQLPIPGLWLGLDIAAIQTANVFGVRKLLQEKEEHVFDESILHYEGSATLWGFWQSEQYFKHAENEVRAAFRFQSSRDEAIIEAKKEVASSNSVSLHVRRGDYLMPANSKLHAATDGSYYQKAIDYVVSHVDSPTFFVFSDDIAWCRENVKTGHPTIFMDNTTAGPKASGHLELMSLCKHNIIANSSFSWWGAWLNENPGKIVVEPEGNAAIPKGWVII